jgi:hypothetical protein
MLGVDPMIHDVPMRKLHVDAALTALLPSSVVMASLDKKADKAKPEAKPDAVLG